MGCAAVFPAASSVGVARSPRVGVPSISCVVFGGWWACAGVIRTWGGALGKLERVFSQAQGEAYSALMHYARGREGRRVEAMFFLQLALHYYQSR